MKPEVLEEAIRSRFSCMRGSYPEFKISCPYCDDSRQRLYINVVKGLGYCFNCGESVGREKLKEMLELKESKSYSANDFESLEEAFKKEKKEDVKKNRIKLEAVFFNAKEIPDEIRPIKKLAMDYLKHRGFDAQTAENYRFMLPFPHVRERGRLILPIFEQKTLVYFQARAMTPIQPKYLNPTKIQCPLGKSNFVFNLDEARNFCHESGLPIVICEGIFSALAVGRNGVAIFGKDLSQVQAWKLMRSGIDEAIIAFDPGTSEESIRAASMLSTRLKIKIADLREGDPNEISKEKLTDTLEKAMPFSALENIFIDR